MPKKAPLNNQMKTRKEKQKKKGQMKDTENKWPESKVNPATSIMKSYAHKPNRIIMKLRPRNRQRDKPYLHPLTIKTQIRSNERMERYMFYQY